MVLLWTALSYARPNEVPSGVPRRVHVPLLWDAESVYHWTVIKVIIKRIVFSIGQFISEDIRKCLVLKSSDCRIHILSCGASLAVSLWSA